MGEDDRSPDRDDTSPNVTSDDDSDRVPTHHHTITEDDIEVTYLASELRRYSRIQGGTTLIIQNPEDRWDFADERPDLPLPQPLPTDGSQDVGRPGGGDIWNNP
ncbi:hypothetical protein AB0H49_33390 [Nocardia sp. NPDC050713]|uniref:hypothetical protein n=1 Tax=Nocardia sp. NPDC050713 TaxID=3154511 RepID=UPI0033EE05B8